MVGNAYKGYEAALQSLLGEIKLTEEEREAAWSAALGKKARICRLSATGPHGGALYSSRSTYPFTGKLGKHGRKQDGKFRLALHRKGQKRLLSNLHSTMEEAFENIRSKAIRLNMDEPAISQTVCVQEGVQPR